MFLPGEAGAEGESEDHRAKASNPAQGDSISKERGTMHMCFHEWSICKKRCSKHSFTDYAEGEQSIHDSLEELADLLGDEEMPEENERGLVPNEPRLDPVVEPRTRSPQPKHRPLGMHAHSIYTSWLYLHNMLNSMSVSSLLMQKMM